MFEYLRANPHLYFDAFAVVGFLGAAVLEAAVAGMLGRRTHSAADSATNLTLYLGSLALQIVWIPVVYGIYVKLHAHSLFKIGEQWWFYETQTPLWVWPLALLADDFTYYWFHRSSHAVRVLWAAHETHHSSRYFNLTVAARQTWLPFTAFVFWIPLVLIGFDPTLVLLFQLASLFYQSLVHTQLVGKLGPLDRILSTPSNHRVHHGRNGEYVDRNFGGVFIVWDRLFGTYIPEGAPVEYGTESVYPPYNPFVVAFRETVRLVTRPAALAALATLLVLSGCEGSLRKMSRDRTLTHLARVKNYHGILRETGLLASGEDLVTEIEFTAPNRYRMKVLAPKAVAGTAIRYDGESSVTAYPHGGWGVRMRGLPNPSPERMTAGLKKILDDAMVGYTYNIDAFHVKNPAPVAGYPVTPVRFEAKAPGAAIPSGDSLVLDELSFPLAGHLNFSNGKIYAYRFDEIWFNQDATPMAAATKAELAKEKSLVFSEWDFAKSPITEAAAKAAANFPWRSPKAPPRELKPIGIFRQRGIVPAFAVVYAAEPYFMTIFIARDYHLHPFTDERGIPWGPRGDRYVPNPHLSAYTLKQDEVIYSVLSNLPAEDLIAYGASLP